MSKPENDDPRERFEQTTRALRRHRPRPSAALVARIEELAERAPRARIHPARRGVTRRRLVLALAATLAVAAAGAIVAGELRPASRSATQTNVLSSPLGVPALGSASGLEQHEKAPGAQEPYAYDLNPDSQAAGRAELQSSASPRPPAPITTSKRLAELRAVLLLKVDNRDQLSARTSEALKIARSHSGYVVSARTNSPNRGIATSYLVLKVPATHAQKALVELSALGKILNQDISLEDLQTTYKAQSDQITGLRREIDSLEKALDDPSLTDAARSQLQVKLATSRAKLSSLLTQHRETNRRGRLATIELSFTTGEMSGPPAEPSRIRKAIDRAWDGLASEISWAAMGLIVSSPFLVLALAMFGGTRIRRRREERRLLEK